MEPNEADEWGGGSRGLGGKLGAGCEGALRLDLCPEDQSKYTNCICLHLGNREVTREKRINETRNLRDKRKAVPKVL